MLDNQIEHFFQSPAFAVVGASNNRHKYGNKVLRCYLQHNKTVWPVHPIEEYIENIKVYRGVDDLPADVGSISVITPHSVTEKVIEIAAKKGIKNIWMQPGAESDLAIQRCKAHSINVIAQGPCILVYLGFKN